MLSLQPLIICYPLQLLCAPPLLHAHCSTNTRPRSNHNPKFKLKLPRFFVHIYPARCVACSITKMDCKNCSKKHTKQGKCGTAVARMGTVCSDELYYLVTPTHYMQRIRPELYEVWAAGSRVREDDGSILQVSADRFSVALACDLVSP